MVLPQPVAQVPLKEHVVRLASPDEMPGIMAFIDQEWKAGHLLAEDAEFFVYQYKSAADYLNLVTAIEQRTGRVDCILGFIPSSENGEFLWLSLWKSRDSMRHANLGLACLRYLLEQFEPKGVACNGISRKTRIVYEFLGYRVDCMKHMYMPNREIQEHRIAIFPSLTPVRKLARGARLIPLDNADAFAERFDLTALLARQPRKDIWYIKRRFFEHPRFDYQVYGLEVSSKIKCAVVVRKQEMAGAAVVRIVDILGDYKDFYLAAGALEKLVRDNAAEYLDLLYYGLSDKELLSAGYNICRDGSGVVVPDYFQPFVRRNVTCNICTSVKSNFTMFKADGDQDRPN